ncbi:MAG: thioesterase family protein [Proteobacteria bacterium]|nr:thioesterase family protein [Pseudomonadota bacterium]
MKPVPVGTAGSFAMVVAPEHLANRFKDSMLPPVLATPVMIMMMENAALEALKPFFDAGETAVGTRVDIEHVASTTVGRHVVAHASVTAFDGRRVQFDVDAKDGDLLLGRGTHGRVVIDVRKFSERLAAQMARAAGDTR